LDGERKPVLVTDVKGKREKVCWGDSTSACLGAEFNVKFFRMFSEKTFYNGFLFDDK
jgi:hypothetical protein